MTDKELRKQEIAKKMKDLRLEAGLTQLQVAEKLGITYQAISNYERGKNSIEIDLLLSMCDIYHADPISVLNPDSKGKIYDVLYSEKSSFEEKCIAALGLLRIYFSRSIGQRDYRLEHPQFDDYVAMLLNQNQFKERFGEDIYNALVQRYGKQPGIPEGHTSYQIEKNNLEMQTFKEKSAKETYSNAAITLARDYDALDNHGKRVVRLVADEEKSRCEKLAKKARMQTSEEIVYYITNWFPNPMSAGTGTVAGDDESEELLLIKRPPRGTSYIAPVSGNSMEPTYHDGDKLFIRACTEIQQGQIGVFFMDGQQWVKELGDGVLISHNPKYAPIPMHEGIRCQGLVLGVCDKSYLR